jgi:hypothetical protein
MSRQLESAPRRREPGGTGRVFLGSVALSPESGREEFFF